MSQLHAYSEADDEVLVEGCSRGDPEALSTLVARHGAVAELALLRELGDAAPRDLGAWLVARLRAEPERLGAWTVGSSTLRGFLAVIARRSALAERGNRKKGLVTPLPTPGAIDLGAARETIGAGAIMHAAKDALSRQPPNVVAVVRLRLSGLERAHIAALLGTSSAQVESTLERVAARLGQAAREASGATDAGDAQAAEDVTMTFRVLLDAATPPERVRFARRTETDRDLARERSVVDAAYRWLQASLLGPNGAVPERTPGCLGPAAVAGYVDGTMRGALRARSEGHVTGCAACLDEIGALSCDLRALPVMRDAQHADRGAIVAAMALSVACFDAGTDLADAVAARRENKSARLAADLARLGRSCRLLQGGGSPGRETSGLVQRDVPSDDEAPLVAFEALALGDSGTAFRAIDEANAPAPVAARVRVLAAAAGGDAPLGHAWARAVKDGYDVDPGAVEDADCVLSLREGEALPREIVVERLRALVPDLVRVVLAMHARPTR